MLHKNSAGKSYPFWILTLSIIVVLTVPVLIQDGMFMDAMLYTSVSHNLSQGIGNFWFPWFSFRNVADLPTFHEQPPLVFGIQALFFKALGNSMYVERVYTFFTTCLTAFLIHFFWKSIFKDQANISKQSWIPVFLWITIPVCFWSYSNNMHENTMGIFTLVAALSAYHGVQKRKQGFMLLVLSGLMLCFASLSKGLPGFFPISLPVLYWLTTKKITLSKAISYTLIMLVSLLAFYCFLMFIPEAKKSLSIYFYERALFRINQNPTVDSRFFILERLVLELLPQIALVLIILSIYGFKKLKHILTSGDKQLSAMFVLLGICGSVPLMLTLVQRGFYMVPSFPFFALGLAILIAKPVTSWLQSIQPGTRKFQILSAVSVFIFISVILVSASKKGSSSRDKEMLQDVHQIGKYLSDQKIIAVPGELFGNWSLQAYFMRYYNLSIDYEKDYEFYLNGKNMPLPENKRYLKVNLPTSQYDLYQKLE